MSHFALFKQLLPNKYWWLDQFHAMKFNLKECGSICASLSISWMKMDDNNNNGFYNYSYQLQITSLCISQKYERFMGFFLRFFLFYAFYFTLYFDLTILSTKYSTSWTEILERDRLLWRCYLNLDPSGKSMKIHTSIVAVPPFQHLLRLYLEQELLSSILPCKMSQKSSPAQQCWCISANSQVEAPRLTSDSRIQTNRKYMLL